MKTLFIACGLFLLSFLLTLMFRYFSIRKNLLSVPNKRSLHNMPIPVGGGVAIVVCWYLGITLLFYLKIIQKELFLALMCGIIVAAISFLDDIREVKPGIRLFFHFLASVMAFIILGGLRKLIIPGLNFNYDYVIYPVAIIGMVWYINLFNFMDGVDGFASLEAIIICLVLFILSGDIVNLILIACILGFLVWNWPKAKIFMGDVGSTQLGFILVVLGIYFHNSLRFSILNWIMLTSPFWFDATLTLYRRWRNRENLSEAHKKHAYQRIVQAGFSHLKVNIWLIMVNCFVVVIILIYREFKFLQVPLFILTLILFYLLTRIIDKKMPFNKS